MNSIEDVKKIILDHNDNNEEEKIDDKDKQKEEKYILNKMIFYGDFNYLAHELYNKDEIHPFIKTKNNKISKINIYHNNLHFSIIPSQN
jgi:hypothetical protein